MNTMENNDALPAREVAFLQCFDRIAMPRDLSSNPYWGSEVGSLTLFLRKYIAAEFYREFCCKDFPFWQIPRYVNNDVKKFIKAAALLWGHVWEMLRRYTSPELPIDLFLMLLEEASLIAPFLLQGDEQSKVACTGILKKIQAENRELESFSNPFPTDTPTGKVVGLMITLASRNNQDRERSMKIVRARMAIASCLKGDRMVKVAEVEGKKTPTERRGRPRKSRAI